MSKPQLMYGQPLSASQRVQKALVRIMHEPKYRALSGVLMIGRRIIFEDTLENTLRYGKTACTNGLDERYNEKFVDLITDSELRFVILHETYHKLFKHLITWQWMHKENHQLANMACDYVINLMISDENKEDNFATMPKITKELLEYTKGEGKIGDPFGLIDNKYANMDSAQVYNLLKRECESGGGGGSGDGSGNLMDLHDWAEAQGMSKEEAQELVRQLDSALRQGALLAGNSQTTGNRNLDELLEPKVHWRDIVREWFKTHVKGSDYSTWTRPNRRYIASNIYMPSGVSEACGGLGVYVDTSGSIGEELRQFFADIETLCQEAKPEWVRLLYWGSAVVGDEMYTQDTVHSIVQSTQPKCGGGTTPSCIKPYTDEHKIKPQAAIVFTDGYVGGDWGQWDAGLDVLFVIVGDKHARPPFGNYVIVD